MMRLASLRLWVHASAGGANAVDFVVRRARVTWCDPTNPVPVEPHFQAIDVIPGPLVLD
jgi:hypothetical protein